PPLAPHAARGGRGSATKPENQIAQTRSSRASTNGIHDPQAPHSAPIRLCAASSAAETDPRISRTTVRGGGGSESFQDALIYQMRRFGDSYWQLYRAIIRLGENFDHKTLLSWIQGERAPRSIASFEILARIERRYRLAEGYFKAKLPHQARSLNDHDLGDISPAERRRLAWHLPDDFGSLPFSKREEIIDWVRRVIISGSADYRRYQAAASKQRYAIRFPGITYGGGSLSPRPPVLSSCASHSAD
ncbi:hypothetical protein RCCGEPOP_35599, partial [Rhizobium sp. Pop5]